MERTYTTPRLDKLGVRPGSRVVLVGIADPDIRADLATRTTDVSEVEGDIEAMPMSEIDLVLLRAESGADLELLSSFRHRIRPNGAIWVVSRKGRAATLRDIEVIAAARAVGLIDNKVASFSDTHTALRLVIPVADRPR